MVLEAGQGARGVVDFEDAEDGRGVGRPAGVEDDGNYVAGRIKEVGEGVVGYLVVVEKG